MIPVLIVPRGAGTMGYRSTADENLDSAVEHIKEAIKQLSTIVIDEVNGHDVQWGISGQGVQVDDWIDWNKGHIESVS